MRRKKERLEQMLSLLPTHNRCQCHFTIPYVMLLIQSLKNGDRFHYFPSVSWLLISSLRKKKVGFKQDERELFWGFRHEKELTRDLSGLFPLRFLFLRPKKKYIYISSGSEELHESPSPHKPSTLAVDKNSSTRRNV